MQQKKSVGIWIRVSTDEQAQGESPEHHEKRARLYAESKGWDVKAVYHLEAMTCKSVMGYLEILSTYLLTMRWSHICQPWLTRIVLNFR